MNHPEYDLQCLFVELLTINHIFFFAVPNQEVRGANDKTRMIAYKRLIKSGSRPGTSDLVILTNKEVIFVEMKSEKGKQRPDQIQFQKDVEELGYKYVVLHNWKECEDFVKSIKS